MSEGAGFFLPILIILIFALVNAFWNQGAIANKNPNRPGNKWIDPIKMSFRSFVLISIMFFIANPRYGLIASVKMLPVYLICSYPINLWILAKKLDMADEENRSRFVIKSVIGFVITLMVTMIFLVEFSDKYSIY